MNLIIVTGLRQHHKRLCAQLVKQFNVVGIIHPAENQYPVKQRIARWIREAGLDGWAMAGFNVLGKMFTRSAKNPNQGKTDLLPFGDSEGARAYDGIPRSLVHPGCDIRTKDCCELIRSLKPDVIVCLGGPVYPKAFIDSSPLMLNFHSGISPIYNGTASIQFAFANGHPHLCGGTLMKMATAVDGGRMLGHYLPAVQSGDSPESLFEKTVNGASLMYRNVLQHLQSSGGELHSVPQPPPLFYTRGSDFGWYHRERINRYLRTDLPARFGRPQCLSEYWREATPEAACRRYQAFLDQLLWGLDGFGNEPQK